MRVAEALPSDHRTRLFLTDAGLETTLIFLEGWDLRDFAAFDLLRVPGGEQALRRYYERYASLAVEHGVGAVLETATWRCSRDWGIKLGYTPDELRATITIHMEDRWSPAVPLSTGITHRASVDRSLREPQAPPVVAERDTTLASAVTIHTRAGRAGLPTSGAREAAAGSPMRNVMARPADARHEIRRGQRALVTLHVAIASNVLAPGSARRRWLRLLWGLPGGWRLGRLAIGSPALARLFDATGCRP